GRTGTPASMASNTESTPASKETWAPQITRDSSSRPRSSVPSQLWASAGLRIFAQFVAWGLYGASHGAPSAVAVKTTIITAPMRARRRRMNRRSKRRPHGQGEGFSGSAGAMGARAAVDLILPLPPPGEYAD